METRVIVADDHTLFRVGLIRMLSSFAGIRIVAEAADAAGVLAAIAQEDAELIILDLSMPGANGVSLIDTVHRTRPNLPILILTMHDEPALTKQALRAGASGYVTKNADPETLAEAVTRVSQGGRYVAPGIAESLAFDFSADDGERKQALTAREFEILRLIAQEGLSLKEIADRLGLSPKTITSHKANLMLKLGIANNVELIRYVVDNNLFD